MSSFTPAQQEQRKVCALILEQLPEMPDYKSLGAKDRSRIMKELHYFLQYLTIETEHSVKDATHEEVSSWILEVKNLSDYYYRQIVLSLIKDLFPQTKWRRPARRPFLDCFYRLRDFILWHFYENKKAALSKYFFNNIQQDEIVACELQCGPFYKALADVSPDYGQIGGFTESDEDIVRSIRRQLPHIDTESQLSIVDIACGAGRLLKRLAQEFPNAKLVGTSIFEFSQEELEAFKENNIEAIFCEADRLNIADGSADIVVCSEVIEHLKDPSSLAMEIDRILKPGGAFCVTAPSKASYMYCNNPISYLSVFLSPYRGLFLPAFHNLYAPLSLIKFVHYGFTPHQFKSVFASSLPYASITTTRFTALRKFRLQRIAPKLPFLKYMGSLCMASGIKEDKNSKD